MTTLCRTCAARRSQTGTCFQCRQTHYITHPELDELAIAHIDCDAFYCAIEKRDNPDITHKPVIIGGGRRGVVASACYIARTYGVYSAMPMFKALKACPQAVVIGGNMAAYAREGQRIRKIMQRFTPLVEPLSIDEAFLNLSGTVRLHAHTPAQSLIILQNQILQDVGISVSVGLSYNKFLAKTASDLDKPFGFAVLGRAEASDFLALKPVQFIYGVGKAFARKLNDAGIYNIADIRHHSDSYMEHHFGKNGLRLAHLARGEDNRSVNPHTIRKSISSELTFMDNIADMEKLKDQLWVCCLKVCDQAKAKNIAGRVVTLKLTTQKFQTLTRRHTLAQPTQLAHTLFHTCVPMLAKVADGRYFRLIGAGLSDLSSAMQPPFGEAYSEPLNPMSLKHEQTERATDQIRTRFGHNAIMTGRHLRQLNHQRMPDRHASHNHKHEGRERK